MKAIPNGTYNTLTTIMNVCFAITVLHLFNVIELPEAAQHYMAGYSVAFILVVFGTFRARRTKKAPLPKAETDRNAR